MDAGKSLCLFDHAKSNDIAYSLSNMRLSTHALKLASDISMPVTGSSDDELSDVSSQSDEHEDKGGHESVVDSATSRATSHATSSAQESSAPKPEQEEQYIPVTGSSDDQLYDVSIQEDEHEDDGGHELVGDSATSRATSHATSSAQESSAPKPEQEEHGHTALGHMMREVFESNDESLENMLYVDPATSETSKYTKVMYNLVALLKSDQGLRMLKNAVRVNMRFKVKKYMKLRASIESRMAIERTKYDILKDQIKIQANLGDDDNWHLFEKLGDQIVDLEKQIAALAVVENRARELLNEDNLDTDGIEETNTTITSRCQELLNALDRLAFYNQQPMILEAVSEIVYGFLVNPAFVRRKFMNFLFAGPAGTGKTSIVREISKVFSVAGIFVFDTVVEGGRNDFIAPYEGQTVGKTMTFLTSGLDSGVIFVDEAYSITTWNDGVPSSYGSEATAAMVDFMTKYKGLYCLMFAGYETDMRRYFLQANVGLPRRIPYQYRLKDYTHEQLVEIYKHTILAEMGVDDKQINEGAIRYIESAFTKETWVWLTLFVQLAREHTKYYYEEPQFDNKTKQYYEREIKIVPKRKYMWEIFKNQAGAMANLAEATVVELINTVTPEQLQLVNTKSAARDMDVDGGDDESVASGSSDYSSVSMQSRNTRGIEDLKQTRRARFLFTRGNGLGLMKKIIKNSIKNVFMSEAPLFLSEFSSVDALATELTNEKFEPHSKARKDLQDKSYVDTDATIDLSSEEVDDSPYDKAKMPVQSPSKQKSRKRQKPSGLDHLGMPSDVDFDNHPTASTFQKDLQQITYCAGSYFYPLYKDYELQFRQYKDANAAWWKSTNSTSVIEAVIEAIKRVYQDKHVKSEQPLTASDRTSVQKETTAKGFTLSDAKNYNHYTVDTYLCFVSQSLDVEITLSYTKGLLDELSGPKFQLRLINKVNFDRQKEKDFEQQVVYSVGVPFAAFRLETAETVLTRDLSIGEPYQSDWEGMNNKFRKLVESAIAHMESDYKTAMSGSRDDPFVSHRKPQSSNGLKRKESFSNDYYPYPWRSQLSAKVHQLNTPPDLISPTAPTVTNQKRGYKRSPAPLSAKYEDGAAR